MKIKILISKRVILVVTTTSLYLHILLDLNSKNTKVKNK